MTANLVELWLLTMMWLLFGGSLALVFTVVLVNPSRQQWLLPVGGLAVFGVLLGWVRLLYSGLRQHLSGSFQHWGWKMSIYVVFIVSQLVVPWWLFIDISSTGDNWWSYR